MFQVAKKEERRMNSLAKQINGVTKGWCTLRLRERERERKQREREREKQRERETKKGKKKDKPEVKKTTEEHDGRPCRSIWN